MVSVGVVKLMIIMAIAILLHSVVFLSRAVLSTDVMAVNPHLTLRRPMPGHPAHFPIRFPVGLAAKIGSIAARDIDAPGVGHRGCQRADEHHADDGGRGARRPPSVPVA